ncbi:autotransporter assembly complex family protein [Zhongshania guokunii]|uniref:Translocation and assembly module subunit TamA n=1 Tax=Zhongshania guokunii TaxID=641783 RepID=A0ABV3U693_9GAMM
MSRVLGLSLQSPPSAITLFLLLLCSVFAAAPSWAATNQVSLEIRGGKSELQDNIRAHLDLSDIHCNSSELRLRSRLRGSDQKISNAMRALGHYHGNWTLLREQSAVKTTLLKSNPLSKAVKKIAGSKSATPDTEPESCWVLTLELTPGPQTLISRLDVRIIGEGENDPIFTKYLAKLPVAIGDPVQHDVYEAIKNSINQRARNAGYIDGQFQEHRIEVNTDTHSATIALVFNSGSRYRFGEVAFGPSLLSTELMRRYLPFQSGDPFDSSKVVQLQNNLISSNYFASVNIDQENPNAEQQRIDLNVQTAEKRKYETTAGIGASTDTGPRVSYGLRNRRINDAGHTYQIASQYSPVLSNLSFQYTIPGSKPLTDKVQLSTGVERKDTDTTESLSYRAEIAQISLRSNNWIQTLSLKFLREDYDIADERNTSTLLMPGIAWSRSEANDRRYPTRGWRINTAARGALQGVVSDVSLAQIELDSKVILPLWGGRVISRGGLGATMLDDFSELPASLRFFAGGDNSVRGYGYETLGPENAEGEVVGGKHRITGSIEYDHRVWGDFALATFFDAGNAFDTDTFTLYESAGLGLRWLSPIGPVRVDFAFPLKDGGFQFHLSMGPDL